MSKNRGSGPMRKKDKTYKVILKNTKDVLVTKN